MEERVTLTFYYPSWLCRPGFQILQALKDLRILRTCSPLPFLHPYLTTYPGGSLSE